MSRRGVLGALIGLGLMQSACAIVGLGGGSRDTGPFGRVEGRPDAGRWLAADASRAKEAGAEDSQVLAVDAGAAGDRISGRLDVPDDACALLLARASDGVDDLDLFAYGDDGTLLGADERPDKSPTLLVCPPHPRRLFVVARVAAGHGLVALGAQRVATKDAERVGKVLAARGFGGESPGRLDAWPGLDEKIALHRRAIGGAWQDVRRQALPLDQALPTRTSTVVEADRCLDVLVVPSEEVSHLDVAVLDTDGRIVGRATAHGRERFLVVCSPDKAALTLEVRPQSGRGFAALVMGQSRTPGTRLLDARVAVHDLAPMAELGDAREKHASLLESAGYSTAKLAGQGTLAVGRRDSLTVELTSGCTRLDVLAGKPARGVEAWLWSSGDALLGHQRGTGRVTLFACGPGGQAQLDLEAVTRPGPFVVEARREQEVPRSLIEQPLAAGRLLGRMLDRGVIKHAGQVGAAKAISLSSTRREALDVLVPIDRCADVTLALGPGATGAEVRLVDAATGNELDLGYGTESASARACALSQGATLRVRAELRVVSGAAEALVASRMLAPRE